MDKIILIFYVDVGRMSDFDVEHYMEKLSDYFSSHKMNDEILSFFIPIRGDGSETRVECVNPKLISEEDYQHAKTVLEENNRIVNEYFKSTNEKNLSA